MDVQTWDAAFVRAPRAQIHPVVAEPAEWVAWWPGLSLRQAGPGFAASLRPPGVGRRVRTWNARVTKNRRDLGVTLAYTGGLEGEAEFYYLDEPAGTVVHYVLRAAVPDRGWRSAVRDHRAGVRAGLHAMKDRFEAGRLPGDEPDPALLEHQRTAMAAFAAGVAADRTRAGQTAAGAAGRGGVA